MKTNLNIDITSDLEAIEFLEELCSNNEDFHPEEDAHDIIWNGVAPEHIPTKSECDKLNNLMTQIYVRTEVDPCEIIVNHINSK